MPMIAGVKYKARAFTNMFVQRFDKGPAVLMALMLSAIPIRFLSILAIAVVCIWTLVAVYAGRQFDKLTAEEKPGDGLDPQLSAV